MAKETTDETPQPGAQKTKRAKSEDVPSNAQGPVTHPPGAEQIQTPVPIEPVSSDNVWSSYAESTSDEWPADQGKQVVETPGMPNGGPKTAKNDKE